ncbi:MAG: DUF6152 family protein [Pseudomonadota bacterium]
MSKTPFVIEAHFHASRTGLLRGLARPFAVLLAGFAASPAQAHHSFAMFDNDHQIKLAGTVTEFKWQNPHVYIELKAPDGKGEMRTWTIECANPGILNRSGWKFNILKPNDKLTVIVSPLRTGEPGALLKEMKLADGTKLSNGGPAGKASIPID